MTIINRRFMLAGAAALALAACDNSIGSTGGDVIDARVDASLDFLYASFPGTQELRDNSAGVLVIPLITEAGLGIGGAFGRGALRVGDVTVDFYSATKASVGLQIGVQQFSHALFFMTEEALQDFRQSPGWVAGADLKYVFREQAESIGAATLTALSPVVAVVFGQTGLIAGATIDGTKYTRIIP